MNGVVILQERKNGVFNSLRNLLALTGIALLLWPQFSFSDYYLDEPIEAADYLQQVTVDESAFSGIEGIDAIYLINLDIRPEKYLRCKALFEEQKLFVNRFSAINGWTLQFDSTHFFGKERSRFNWREGQIGCVLSHLSVLQDGFDRGYQCIWIMEDDIRFVGDISRLSLIIDKLNAIDPDWDIYYTDSRPRKCRSVFLRPEEKRSIRYFNRDVQKIDDEIEKIGFRLGTFSYLFSRKGMEKVIHHFTHAYWLTTLDIELHLIPTIREYGHPEDLVTIDSLTISDTEVKPRIYL